MLGNDFTYNGHSLSDYNMKMYDPENSQQFASRVIDKAEITSIRPIPNHYSTHYADVLTLNFFITKDNDEYPTQKDMRMSSDDINTLRSWLESPKKPLSLFVEAYDEDIVSNDNDDDDESTDIYYFGIFSDVQPFIVNQECYGLYLTFTCDSPYGFSDIIDTEYVLGNVKVLEENGSDLITENDSDIYVEDGYKSAVYVNNSAEQNDYLKPIITIKSSNRFVSGETIRIKNATDGNKEMYLVLPSGKTSIIIDCKKKIITDGSGNIISLSDVGLTLPISSDYNFISSELYTFYWLRLLYGNNSLTFECPGGSTVSKITISARHIIKSGGF